MVGMLIAAIVLDVALLWAVAYYRDEAELQRKLKEDWKLVAENIERRSKEITEV